MPIHSQKSDIVVIVHSIAPLWIISNCQTRPPSTMRRGITGLSFMSLHMLQGMLTDLEESLYSNLPILEVTSIQKKSL